MAPDFLADFATPFHQACLQIAPTGPFRDAYQTIVCGSPLPASQFREHLEHTGLYFLLASAATHLLFVEAWLRWLLGRFRLAWFVVFTAMLLLTLISAGSAPALRALSSLILSRLITWLKLGWSRTQVITAAGLTALCFSGSRASLLGLLLSWIASLAVGGFSGRNPTRQPNWWRHLLSQVRIYGFLIPPLLPISVPHPIAILAAFTFFPSLGMILYSLSLLAFFAPSLVTLIDWQWIAFSRLVEILSRLIPPGLNACSIPLSLLLAYLILLTTLSWRMDRQ